MAPLCILKYWTYMHRNVALVLYSGESGVLSPPVCTSISSEFQRIPHPPQPGSPENGDIDVTLHDPLLELIVLYWLIHYASIQKVPKCSPDSRVYSLLHAPKLTASIYPPAKDSFNSSPSLQLMTSTRLDHHHQPLTTNLWSPTSDQPPCLFLG